MNKNIDLYPIMVWLGQETIDLTKILRDCPKGTKLYSLLHGEVLFRGIDENSDYPIVYDIIFSTDIINMYSITRNGTYSNKYNGECILFPSKDQRDWSKFSAPWYKKSKFDPKTLKSFDKVLVRDYSHETWRCDFFSHKRLYILHPLQRRHKASRRHN